MKIYTLSSIILLIALLTSCAPVTSVPSPVPTSAIRPNAVATRPVSTVPWPGLHDGWMRFFSFTYIDKVAFDPEGSLFASTNDGRVVRWDIETQIATEITPVDRVPGVIYTMTVHKGVLWAALVNGQVGRYSNGTWDFQKLASTLYSFSVTGDDLWLSSNNKLFHLEEKRWHVFEIPSQVTEKTISKVAQTPDGTLWFWVISMEAPHIVSLAKDGKWQTYENLQGVMDIVGEPGGRTWFLYSTLAVSLENGKWSSLVLPNNTFIYSVFRSKLTLDGDLWLLTSKGTFIVENRVAKEIATTSPQIPEMLGFFTPIILTETEAIYLNGNVVYLCDYASCRGYAAPATYSLDRIVRNQVIGFTPDGALWTRNQSSGLIRFDGEEVSIPFKDFDRGNIVKADIGSNGSIWTIHDNRENITRIHEYLPLRGYGIAYELSNILVDFAVTSDNNVWVAFEDGMIARFSPDDPSNKEIWSGENFYGLVWAPVNKIKIGGEEISATLTPIQIEVDSNGNVFVLIEQGNLYRFNGMGWKYLGTVPASKDSPSFFLEPSGEIWVASSTQLMNYDGAQWKNYSHEDLNPSTLVAGSDGFVWIADNLNGVYNFNGQTWEHFTHVDGLPDGQISKILPAPDGALWFFSQYDGWARYKP